jgi:hypothetical protein
LFAKVQTILLTAGAKNALSLSHSKPKLSNGANSVGQKEFHLVEAGGFFPFRSRLSKGNPADFQPGFCRGNFQFIKNVYLCSL